MGWFAIACIVGYLSYWGWRQLTLPYATRRQIPPDAAKLEIAIVAFAIVIFSFIVWAIWSQDARSAGQIADDLGDGHIARILLGFVLGLGAAFFVAVRLPAPPNIQAAVPANAKPPSPPAGGAPPATDSGEPTDATGSGLPTHVALSMALGILLLALGAPHIDRWLAHITAVKSPVVELQLAGTSTHKVSVDEGLDALFYLEAVDYLTVYDEKIGKQIEYFTTFDPVAADRDKFLTSANAIHNAFTTVVVPAAKCLQAAIDAQWLSIESARRVIDPLADLLDEIIFAEEPLKDDSKITKVDELDLAHKHFWEGLSNMPKMIAARVPIKQCKEFPQPDISTLPKLQQYRDVPYLYVAATLMMGFLADNDKALRILEKARSTHHKDYYFLYLMGRLRYYQGKPGDIIGLYLGPLVEMRRMAETHIETLENAKQTCAEKTPLLCYEQTAKLSATNMAAYFIAEDLARDNPYAVPYEARLHDYIVELKTVVDQLDKAGKDPFNVYVQNGRYDFLDTYAYAMLVIEARKPNPDYDVIRKTLVPMLKSVVGYRREKISRAAESTRRDIAQLRTSEAHLASALDLGGE